MPVLAKQAVERAALKKNRQILKTGFSPATIGELRITGTGSAGADPVGNTIDLQRIMIP